MREYRIKVEKRPDEDFNRYYPEVSCEGIWKNTQFPIEIRWYKEEDECKSHINMLKEHEKINKGGYIIKIIEI